MTFTTGRKPAVRGVHRSCLRWYGGEWLYYGLMRALITGAAGCICSDLAEALVARGDQVVGIDNLSSGKTEHIAQLLGKESFRFIEGDLENYAVLEEAMHGVDMVWHLAANPDVKFTAGDATDKHL